MQAERIPTREEILARRAKLGVRTRPTVVPVERVWSLAKRLEMAERERERLAIEEHRRLEDEQRAAAERLSGAIDTALEAYKSLAKSGNNSAATMVLADVARWIIRDEAELADIDRSDIMSQRRGPHVVMARHRAMYRVKRITNWSLPHIGRFFGGRDHTTVLFAIRKIETMVAKGAIADPSLRDMGDRHDA
jgi:chromosomal replication initiation ATPase DnaA